MPPLNFKKILPGLQEHISLAPYTTFHIGGKARYFFAAKSTKDILRAVGAARKLRIPFFILGEGSNVLVSDKGFTGLVVRILNTKYQILNTRLYVEAGVSFPTIVRETGKHELSGLEWAGGLPGTVGGAVRGNAGAFGGEVKDSLISVECVDDKGKVRKLSNRECEFSYRSSIFKQKKWIVLSVVFQLKNGNRKSIEEIAQAHIQYRKERHPLEFPNAGSIFKNCDLQKIPLRLRDFVKPAVKVDPFLVVPTAFLVHQAGLKGLRQGDAQVSEKHPNYIVNLDRARSKDVRSLISRVKQKIKKRFSVALEEEIEYVR